MLALELILLLSVITNLVFALHFLSRPAVTVTKIPPFNGLPLIGVPKQAKDLWENGRFSILSRSPPELRTMYENATPDEREAFLSRIYNNACETHELSANLIGWGLKWLLHDFHRKYPSVQWHWSSAWELVIDQSLPDTDR